MWSALLLLLLVPELGAHQCAYRTPPASEVIRSRRPTAVRRRGRSVADQFHFHTVFDPSVTRWVAALG